MNRVQWDSRAEVTETYVTSSNEKRHARCVRRPKTSIKYYTYTHMSLSILSRSEILLKQDFLFLQNPRFPYVWHQHTTVEVELSSPPRARQIGELEASTLMQSSNIDHSAYHWQLLWDTSARCWDGAVRLLWISIPFQSSINSTYSCNWTETSDTVSNIITESASIIAQWTRRPNSLNADVSKAPQRQPVGDSCKAERATDEHLMKVCKIYELAASLMLVWSFAGMEVCSRCWAKLAQSLCLEIRLIIVILAETSSQRTQMIVTCLLKAYCTLSRDVPIFSVLLILIGQAC